MSYYENRISDLIDGSLKEYEESIQIDFAVYENLTDSNPDIRYKELEDAKKYFLDNRCKIITGEVSVLRNGKRIIIQERIIKSPQIWLSAKRFIPEFDDEYLCHIVKKEECGNFKKYQKVLSLEKGKWNINIGERVTHFMIVESPETKLKLL